MAHRGIKPTYKDAHDKPFQVHRLFGAVSFPDEYNADSGLNFPDQNALNRPSACSAFAVCDIGTNEDKLIYSHDYQLQKTFEVMNVPSNTEGADARTAFKIPCSFGLLPITQEPVDMKQNSQEWAANPDEWGQSYDLEAKKNVKAAYLPIGKNGDYFDGVRQALLVGKDEHRAIGMATRWSEDFNHPIAGLLTVAPSNLYWGHMYVCVGWKQINGEPRLIIKPWEGKDYGDGGFAYMSRSTCNRLLGEWGAYAATLQDLPQGEIDNLKRQVNYLDVILALLQNLYIKVRYGLL